MPRRTDAGAGVTACRAARAAVMLVVLACAPARTPPAADSTAVVTLRQATTQFLAAFDSLDWSRFAAVLSDTVDAYWPRPDSAEHLVNRAQVEAQYRAFFERIRATRPGPPYLHLNATGLAARVIGPVGIVTFELSDVPDTVGRRTLVFRQEGGRWRIIHLHASNLPRLE